MSDLFPGDAHCPPWVKEVVSNWAGMVIVPTLCASDTENEAR